MITGGKSMARSSEGLGIIDMDMARDTMASDKRVTAPSLNSRRLRHCETQGN